MPTIEELQQEILRLREEKAQEAKGRRIKKMENAEKKKVEALALQVKMEQLSIKEKSLEKLVLRSTMGNKWFDAEKFSPPAGLALPENFVATDLPIFKVTNNP